MLVHPEVMAQVAESILRLNGEASGWPVMVDDVDLRQRKRIVCCIAVTADVYQASTDGRVPKDARLIVSAKPRVPTDGQGRLGLLVIA